MTRRRPVAAPTRPTAPRRRARRRSPSAPRTAEGYEPTAGISDDEIKVGSSFAQSGLYEAYSDISKGYLAYIEYYNETEGGVDGRRINVLTADDGYVDPSATAANVDAFVDEDGVFAIYNVVGTPNNLEIRGDLGTRCVPNLYAATGSQLMGEPATYPWTIGSIPSYATESAIFVQWLEDNKPEAKIGVLSTRTTTSASATWSPLQQLVEESDGLEIVSEETYNPGEERGLLAGDGHAQRRCRHRPAGRLRARLPRRGERRGRPGRLGRDHLRVGHLRLQDPAGRGR